MNMLLKSVKWKMILLSYGDKLVKNVVSMYVHVYYTTWLQYNFILLVYLIKCRNILIAFFNKKGDD